MRQDDLGLGSTVSSPYLPGWADEQTPDNSALEALRAAFNWLEQDNAARALGALVSIRERDFEGSPSFTMRWRCYLASAYFDVAGEISDTEAEAYLRNSCDQYKRALSLAVSHSDTLSQVTLHHMLGEAYHNLKEYELALSEYLTALTALRRFPPGDQARIIRNARAEIKLLSRLARQQYLLGQFATALDNLSTSRKIRARFGGPATTQWDRAAEEWIEALVLRAESQRCGGDIKLLRVASHLFKNAEKRLEGDERHSNSLRRLYIQIAETHLDLAEGYRATGKNFSYIKNMEYAGEYAIKASDELHRVNDSAGRAMATLVLLRHDHLSLLAYDLPARVHDVRRGGDNSRDSRVRALASRIYDVERKAVEMNDLALIARTATLRADVLAAMHDFHAALVVYYFAITAFERAGARGESTRAVYGVRKVLDLV